MVDPLDSIVDEFLSKQKISLPSKKELKKVEKVIKKQHAEDYAELTGTEIELT
jgi:rRNA maturation endonuclease Nob1